MVVVVRGCSLQVSAVAAVMLQLCGVSESGCEMQARLGLLSAWFFLVEPVCE